MAPPASPFVQPPELKDAVVFWTRMFTEFDHGHVVVHDAQYVDVIWQVVELPRDRRGRLDIRAGRRRVREATSALQKRLSRLAQNATPQDGEDAALLQRAVGSGGSPQVALARLQGAATRVRSQQGVADDFARGMRRFNRQRQQIEGILASAGVPVDVAALPFVESMYNSQAQSAVGAAGIWQLMPKVAQELGLKVRRGHDQRRDTARATRAAAKLLRRNYALLHDWPLAITAYNHGAYGVKRAAEQCGSYDLIYLIEHYQKDTWGFSSKNFYAEFLAARALIQASSRPLQVAHAATR